MSQILAFQNIWSIIPILLQYLPRPQTREMVVSTKISLVFLTVWFKFGQLGWLSSHLVNHQPFDDPDYILEAPDSDDEGKK